MATPQIVQINGNVQWRIGRTRSGNYLAVCDPLKLTLQAATLDDLAEDISLALDALLKDLWESNEFNQFLHEHGWVLLSPMPKRPEDVHFEVPFFLAMKGNGSQAELH